MCEIPSFQSQRLFAEKHNSCKAWNTVRLNSNKESDSTNVNSRAEGHMHVISTGNVSMKACFTEILELSEFRQCNVIR